jgi:hypothetical protein
LVITSYPRSSDPEEPVRPDELTGQEKKMKEKIYIIDLTDSERIKRKIESRVKREGGKKRLRGRG